VTTHRQLITMLATIIVFAAVAIALLAASL
jgi:hypothetical protein